MWFRRSWVRIPSSTRTKQTKQKGVKNLTPFVFGYYGANSFANIVAKNKVVDLSTFCGVRGVRECHRGEREGKTSSANALRSQSHLPKTNHPPSHISTRNTLSYNTLQQDFRGGVVFIAKYAIFWRKIHNFALKSIEF